MLELFKILLVVFKTVGIWFALSATYALIPALILKALGII